MADLILDQNILPNLEGRRLRITGCFLLLALSKALKGKATVDKKLIWLFHGPIQKMFVA